MQGMSINESLDSRSPPRLTALVYRKYQKGVLIVCIIVWHLQRETLYRYLLFLTRVMRNYVLIHFVMFVELCDMVVWKKRSLY